MYSELCDTNSTNGQRLAYQVVIAIACLWIHPIHGADQGDKNVATTQANSSPYELGLALQTLERDLTSADYRAVLSTMIPTDLAAEWQRIGTPDNYLLFARQHGGLEQVAKDPQLQAAYEHRKQIVDQYLELMREAYRNKNLQPPFDDPKRVDELLEKVGGAGKEQQTNAPSIQMVLTIPHSERQWPGFRGPTGQGIVASTELPTEWSDTKNVLWQTPLPGRGNSSPVIWNDRLFVTAEASPRNIDAPLAQADNAPDRLLLCYSRDAGEQLWQHVAPRPSQHEVLYWKNTLASSTPVTDGERVIAFFGNAGMLCCDLQGKQLWHTDLGSFPIMHGPGSTPIIYQHLVILIQDQNEGESLCVALNKATGAIEWKKPRKNSMGWSSPVVMRIGERDELIFNGSNEVVAYDPMTGDELWKASGTSIESIPMIVSGGGLLYSASGRNGPIFALRPGGNGDVSESHVVWRLERGGPHVPTPAYYEQRLYIVSDTGVLSCLDAASGEMLAQKRLRGRFSASPFIVGERLYVLNEEGITSIFSCDANLSPLGQNDLRDTTYATPAVLDGRLYFRTAQKLICIGER